MGADWAAKDADAALATPSDRGGVRLGDKIHKPIPQAACGLTACRSSPGRPVGIGTRRAPGITHKEMMDVTPRDDLAQHLYRYIIAGDASPK